MINWKNIAQKISLSEQQEFSITRSTPVAGGDISQSWRVEGLLDNGNAAQYFVKLNTANRLDLFTAECAGLRALAASNSIRTPKVIACDISEGHAFLALEFLPLHNTGDSQLLGTQLAALHRQFGGQFGWDHDNSIGLSPQPNNWHTDWKTFWAEQRLGFQLELAARYGCGNQLQKLGKQTIDALDDLLAAHHPQPSLLHGDLWSGNCAFLGDGSPFIFDPAVYFGDREADLAMTELFGGYDAAFYAAYERAFPLDAGYATRKTLYNLYHILNHYNLFGGSYARQAEGMMQSLLASIR